MRYYAEAAESALLHFSPTQTLSLTERAMALLPQVTPSPECAALEVTLATLRGAAAMQVMGFSSPEAKQAFERALALLDGVPQHPLRGLVLSVLGLAYQTRGELEEAAALRVAAKRCGRRTRTGRRWSALASYTACWSVSAGGRRSHAIGWKGESARSRSSTRARLRPCSRRTPA
jgi:hypothetical protein